MAMKTTNVGIAGFHWSGSFNKSCETKLQQTLLKQHLNTRVGVSKTKLDFAPKFTAVHNVFLYVCQAHIGYNGLYNTCLNCM